MADAGNVELDVAELRQNMPLIVAIAAIGSVIRLGLVEIAVDRGRLLIFDDLRQGLPAKRAITLGSLQAVGLHCLHDFKGHR
jgi:hypothetical protein